MRNLKQLACVVALVSSSMAYSEIYNLEFVETTGRLYTLNVGSTGATEGNAIVKDRKSETIPDTDMGRYIQASYVSVFDAITKNDPFAQYALNGGVAAYNGGGVQNTTQSNVPYPVGGSNYPAFKDLSHSGFNTAGAGPDGTVTGMYELKFTLVQKTLRPDPGLNTMILKSVLFYDPVSGKGHIQTLQCENVNNPGTTVPASDGGDGSKIYSDVCSATNAGGSKNFVKDLPPYISGTNAIPDYNVLGSGSIVFDSEDDRKFKITLGNLQNAQLEIDFEMRSVPVPAAVWLFGSAVLGLLGSRRFKKNK